MHRISHKEPPLPFHRERRTLLSWLKGLFSAVLGILLLSLTVVFGIALAFFLQIERSLPSVQALKDYRPPIVSSVYAADGSLIGEFYAERRYPLPLADMPPLLIQAFLAAEDVRFFEHPGLDFIGIARATLKNLRAGEIVQGGSTITQQVAKALLLTPERTWTRKIKEAILAYRIDHSLTKDEILYIYLNQIYLGEGAYGVEAAALTYFNKHVRALNLAECALLAGLPQAPSRYSPLKNPDLARDRQHHVLQQMVGHEFISREEARQALQAPLVLGSPRRWTLKDLNYFTEQVRREVETRYGHDALYREGLQITTTMDPNAQQIAERALDRGLRELDKRHGYRGVQKRVDQAKWSEFLRSLEVRNREVREDRVLEALVRGYDKKSKTYLLDVGAATAALPAAGLAWAQGRLAAEGLRPGDVVWVKLGKASDGKGAGSPWVASLEQSPNVQGAFLAMNHHSGAVLCMVGGRDFEESQFNRAVQALRQPGSAFKPIVYAAALDHGYTPTSTLMDTAVAYSDGTLHGRWVPANYDNKFWGAISLRNALIHSRNVVTVKLLQDIGVNYVQEYARQLGIGSPLTPTLALALGASGVSLWDMITAYSTFAQQGERVEPYLIERVVDRYGEVLEQHRMEREAVISPDTAYLVTNILEGVIQEGTGRRARKLGRPAAGKTGTSNDLKDAWFIGYTPSVLAGVWIGYDDLEASLGAGETGGHAACPVWLYFMEDYLRDTPVEAFPVPANIVFARVNSRRGEVDGEASGKSVYQAFRTEDLQRMRQAAEAEEGGGPTATGLGDSGSPHDTMDSFFKSDLF